MADPVEVAIESALLNRAQSYATSQSLTIALPNVITTPPVATPAAKWLQAFFLPAPTAGLGISPNSTNQHYGIFQISVYYGLGSGELAPARIAAGIISYFKFGTEVTKDGFTAKIWKPPYRGPSLNDGTWLCVPVSIPFVAFAANPA
jgi:hypothetical protein